MNTTTNTSATYKPAKAIAVTESTVTVHVDGVGDTTISWSQLYEAVNQGGHLGMKYYFLAEQAEYLLHGARLARLLAAGYSVTSREVGCRFGRRGVIPTYRQPSPVSGEISSRASRC